MNNKEKGPEPQKEYPGDFPLPTKFEGGSSSPQAREWKKNREERKKDLSDENGDYYFYFNNGQMDKEWMTNMWYGFRREGLGFDSDYAKPEDIEVRSSDQLYKILGQLRNYFSESSAYKKMLSRPENDPKRQQVLDFQAELILRSLSKNLREQISEAPELKEKVRELIKIQIRRAVFSLRNEEKIQQRDEETLEEWKKIADECAYLIESIDNEIQDI